MTRQTTTFRPGLAPKWRCTSPPNRSSIKLRRLKSSELPVRTVALARALLGCVLVRDSAEGRAAGRIVEVEAYVPGDRASHAFGGLRKRNAPMFLDPHRAYVYRIYGTSFCFNVTSEAKGEGAAVLIRALEPIEGLALMQDRRERARPRDLCRGPGRLCLALEIDERHNGIYLLRDRRLWLAAAGPERRRIGTSKRIGITKAAHRRLRFFLTGSPFLSGPRSLSAGTARSRA